MTPQERLQAFALYLGQRVEINRPQVGFTLDPMTLTQNWDRIIDGKCRLLLKPLSAISDEDAKAIAKIRGYINFKDVFGVENGYWIKLNLAVTDKFVNWVDLYVAEIDYLRSRGYCLPYLGYDLVAEGVAKLIEK